MVDRNDSLLKAKRISGILSSGTLVAEKHIISYLIFKCQRQSPERPAGAEPGRRGLPY